MKVAEQVTVHVDRVGALRALVGPLQPALRPRLEGDPVRAEETRRQIGRLYLAERMTPCDEVLSVRRRVQ